jgi:hypothetical protein
MSHVVAIAGLIACTVAPAAMAQTDDEAAVLDAINTMFDGLAARDTAMMASVLDPATRLVQTFSRDGAPAYRTASMEQFLGNITREGPPIREEIRDPQVVIHDNLATVWVSYAFFVDGQVSHCGEDAFQLARRTTGWVIVAIADTQRREECD